MLVKTIRDELRTVTDRAKAVMAKAEDESRLLTDAERTDIDAALADAEKLAARIAEADARAATLARFDGLSAGKVTPLHTNGAAAVAIVKSLGTQFVESDAYREWRAKPGARGGNWSTAPVELIRPSAATTVTPTGGILPTSFLPPNPPFPSQFRVSGLFGQGTVTDGSIIPYLRETVFTNAAATVAEAAAKPEATLTFEQVQDPLRTIAHWLPVTEQMLEDLDGLRSYIDARLTDGVIQVEESQIINGNGTPPNLRGLLNQTGLATAVPATGGAFADAIHLQIMTIMASSYVMPDAVVVSPAAWHLIATERGTAGGGYLAGGTFAAETALRLWGLPVVVSPYIPADTAVVGAFKSMGMVWRKGGITVQASNSHADYFIRNMVAIRAEERLQLTIFRPAAFGLVTDIEA